MTSEASTPNPDPTTRTNEGLLREITQLESQINRRITSERELVTERFNSVNTRFDLMESQRKEQKSDTRAAVDAALAAAKEAVKEQKEASDRSITKTETATDAQLRQLNQTFQTAIAGLSKNNEDLKERVVSLEASKQGGRDERSDQRSGISSSTAIIGAAVMIISILITVALAVISLA